MKTDDLLSMLATGAGVTPRNAAPRRYAIAIGAGTMVSAVLMVRVLHVRADLAAAIMLPMFWVKLAFVAGLAAPALLATFRLSRPGRRLGRIPVALTAPVIAIWLLAAFVMARADDVTRVRLFYGDTWNVCPLLIVMLSAPVFVGVMWAMKGLAPTRLRLAGATAGLLSGAVGALVYCLHCPEMGAPFIGFWYLLGVLIPAAIGALLGPRLLRW